MAEAKPRHNDDDSGNRRLTRTKAKVEATESRRLTRAKNQKDKVINSQVLIFWRMIIGQNLPWIIKDAKEVSRSSKK